MNGRLFVIKGPDGIGRTTLVKEIHTLCEENRMAVALMSFPGPGEGTARNTFSML